MTKEVEVVTLTYEQFSEWGMIPPGSFFICSALQLYTYFKTSDKVKAQAKCDEMFDKGKYKVISVRTDAKTKCKNESGEYTATGVGTRKK